MFFTDWEGPWILTDFAYELTVAVFNNDRFFRNLSEYDDYLAYVVKRGGYEAGYTVKLLVPFLAAAGVSNEFVRKLAVELARFVPEASKAMEMLLKWDPVVISTSYRQYLEATASMLKVRTVHGSEVDFDSLNIPDELKAELIVRVDEIASLDGEELFAALDELFSREEIRRIVDGVKAIGAAEKARILRDYVETHNIDFPVAVGDSISDYKMFEAARRLGGVAIAFNGNEYALKHADIAIVSSTAVSEAAVIDLFMRKKDEAFSEIRGLRLPDTEIFVLDECDIEEVIRKSKAMRVRLRGAAGELG